MSGAIQAVIFDYGNVVSRFDLELLVDGLRAASSLDRASLRRAVRESGELARSYEAGRITTAAFASAFALRCGFQGGEDRLREAYTRIFTPIPETLELIGKLRPRYRLGLLSNTSPWHFEHEIRLSPAFPFFEAVTLSFQAGALKPDRAIYLDALRRLNLPPERCAYIDDIRENAEAAAALGMRGIHYRDPETLAASLRSAGVLV
ncbi:MAG: HAD family phosphatase [Bacteroidota bacterium]